jgi:microcystin-dependent protein
LNYTLGATGGEESHTLTTSEMPSHTHSVTDPGHAHSVVFTGSFFNNGEQASSGITYLGTLGATTYNTQSTGANISIQNTPSSSIAFNNTPQYTTVNFIIKYQ